MKSKRVALGELIHIVDERNKDMLTDTVLGISIDKEFIPSVANIIGTDLSNYKVVHKGRFACNPMHVGRDERLPVCLYSNEQSAIVSPAYFLFECNQDADIVPEYLNLCFHTDWFDKNCWLRTDSSVRGGISWDDLCLVDIPVPPIEEQRKIVRQYKVVTERCRILRQNCSVLTDIAINVYKNECVKKCENSGSLVKKIGDFCPVITGKKDVNCTCENGKYPFFSCSKDAFTTDDYSFDGDAILIAGNGDFNAKYYSGKFEAYQRTYVLIPTNSKIRDYLYYAVLFSLPKATSGARGSVISFITKGIVENLEVHMLNDKKQFELMCTFFSIINNSISNMEKEMSYINKICNGILQRL